MLFIFRLRSEIDSGSGARSLAGRTRHALFALADNPAILFAFALRVSAAGAAYLLFASVARTVSHAEYGAFAIFFSIISACSTVSPLGQQSVAFKYLPAMYRQRDEHLRSLLRSGLYVSALGSLCFSAPAIVIILLSLGRPGIPLAVISLPVVMICTLSEYLFAVSRALGSVYASIIAKELLWRLLFLVFLAAGVALGTEIDGYRLGVFLLLATGLSVLVLGRGISVQMRDFPKSRLLGSARISAGEAATFFGITVANAAMTHLDTTLMGLTAFQSDVPVYFSALRITQALHFFLYAYSMIKAPDISVAYHEGRFDKLTHLSRAVGRRAGLLVFVACACVVAFSGQLLALFSPDFASGANVLRILCVGPLILTLGGLHSWIPPLCGLEMEYLVGRTLILGSFFALKVIVIFCGTIEMFALLSSAELCAITLLGIFLARVRLQIWIV